MEPIEQLRQDMLDRMQALRQLSQAGAVLQAQAAEPAGFRQSFAASLLAVDAQQHQASAKVAAVDSGRSDDLVGAMLDSQKASVSFSALLQVRNKLATAFDDVIKMPL